MKDLVSSFGKLKSFYLAKNSEAVAAQFGASCNKGYAFCEFEDPAATPQAIAGLDGLQVGEKKLTCRLAESGKVPAAAAQVRAGVG